MAVDPQVARIVTAYGDRVAAVRAAVVAYVERAWGSLDSWREPDIDRFVAAVLPVVSAGQVQTASLTDAYLAMLESAVLGGRVRPIGVSPVLVADDALRGVPASEVYRRPGITVWTALSEGVPLRSAVERGLRRATGLAATDLQLAKTHTARRVLESKDHVVGHRRALKGARSCGLCIVAATQRYRKSELQPIHGGCDCGVIPIYADADPGQVIDPDTLGGVHALIAERFGAFNSGARKIPGVKDPSGKPLQYRDVLVTHEHGELGPILGIRGQKFTGPSDI